MPALCSTCEIIDEVVVLPCVPATAMPRRSSMTRASISARRSTGRPAARAARSSGLASPIADDVTTSAASPRLAASWPTVTATPASLEQARVARGLEVRAPHVDAELGQHRGDAAHAGAADADEVDRLREVCHRVVAHRAPRLRRRQDVLDLIGHALRGVRSAQCRACRRHRGEARAVAEQLGGQRAPARRRRARRRRREAPRRRRPSPARSCAGGRRWRTGTAPGSPACRERRARRRIRPSAPRPGRPPPWRRPGGQCRAPGDSAQTAHPAASRSARTCSSLRGPQTWTS